MRLAFVTGTDGKTTTTTMLASIVEASGELAARVTSVGAWVGDERVAAATDADFAATLERGRARGVKTFAVEVTSVALQDGIAERWPAEVGVFTNLSRDHIDIHKTLESYLGAKAQLFLTLRSAGTAVLNASDPASALLAEVVPHDVATTWYAPRPVVGACAAASVALQAVRIEVGDDGTRITLAPSPLAERLGGRVEIPEIGEAFAEDALAAAVAADALGYVGLAIRQGLAMRRAITCRFERVTSAPMVIVDFAHTPAALGAALHTARGLARRRSASARLVSVFGCRANRDTGKRPMMGRVASEVADIVIVTTDNPDAEDPSAIAAAIESGASGGATVIRELDREAAIARAIELAHPDDVIVISGKDEATQLVHGAYVPFSDVELARSFVAKRST